MGIYFEGARCPICRLQNGFSTSQGCCLECMSKGKGANVPARCSAETVDARKLRCELPMGHSGKHQLTINENTLVVWQGFYLHEYSK